MQKNEPRIHAHPIMIFVNIKRFIWLWIIPILRALLSALQGKLYLWSQGLWLDILVICLIFVFSATKWWRCTYSYKKGYVVQREGLFFSKSTIIAWNKISVLKIMRPLSYRPFGATIFHADAVGGSYRNPDIRIILSKKEGEKLIDFRYAIDSTPCEVKTFTPKTSSVLIFALVSANYFAGFFYIATFISQSGKLLGQEFSEMIWGSFENLARALSEYIPPAAAAIAYLLIFTWLIGVIFTVLRYYKYHINRENNNLSITGGLLRKQHFIVNIHEINFINIQQNVVTYLLKVCSVFISSVGLKKEKSDTNCIIPAESKNTYMKKIEHLFPEFSSSAPLTLKPIPYGFMRFLGFPLFTILVVLVLLRVSLFLIPSWSSFIRFVSYMLFIPCVGFFLIRLVEYRTSGVGRRDGLYTMSYSTWFTLHTVLIPTNKITRVRIRQSWLQYASGNCDVYIYTVSETRKHHKCRNIKKTEAIKFFDLDENVKDTNVFGDILIRVYDFFGIKKKRRQA